MPQKILPNTLDEAELLEILKNNKDKDAQDDAHNDVLDFVGVYDIESGEKNIESRVLYELYSLWSKRPLKRIDFTFYLCKYVPHYTNAFGTWFRVNTDIFKVSQSSLDLLIKKHQNKTTIQTYQRHFNNFLAHYDLKPGHLWLEGYILYSLYDIWAYKTHYNKANNPLGYQQFLKFLTIHFKVGRKLVSKIRFFQVNKDILKYLPKKHLTQLRKGRSKFHVKRKKRKDQKGKKEESKNG